MTLIFCQVKNPLIRNGDLSLLSSQKQDPSIPREHIEPNLESAWISFPRIPLATRLRLHTFANIYFSVHALSNEAII